MPRRVFFVDVTCIKRMEIKTSLFVCFNQYVMFQYVLQRRDHMFECTGLIMFKI